MARRICIRGTVATLDLEDRVFDPGEFCTREHRPRTLSHSSAAGRAGEAGLAEGAMEDWWAGIEGDVLACLADGAASPGQIGGRLGISPAAVTSVLTLLALEGKILISRVELAPAGVSSSTALSQGRVSGVA